MKTSDKLKSLFEYQEFVKDPDFICMKADAESINYALSDEELAMASGGLSNDNNIEKAELIGRRVIVHTANGEISGNIIDVDKTRVLLDSVGWVDIKDTDLCQ